MTELRLIHPTLEFMDSYLDLCREFKERKITVYASWDDPDSIRTPRQRQALVLRYRDHREGRNLPEGFVPYSSMWLLDGETIIGSVSLRHRLNAFLRQYSGHIGYGVRPSVWGRGYGSEQLRLALIEAEALRIRRVLISCNEDNTASRKIIEKNGGRLECVTDGPAGDSSRKRRYWIDLGGCPIR